MWGENFYFKNKACKHFCKLLNTINMYEHSIDNHEWKGILHTVYGANHHKCLAI